ncbi:MAG: hypothetical protein ACOX8L_04130 [Candidatus Methanomethylophilaceae archaeon]|jgi:hypothetical protein
MRMNRKGVIGMPVRLATAFLILAVAVPIMMGAAGHLEKESDAAGLREQADIMSATAEKAYYGGTGSVYTADVRIAGNCMLEIGGDGSDAYRIKMFSGNEEVGCTVMERPPVKFCSHMILTGTLKLCFEYVESPKECGVKVTVIA